MENKKELFSNDFLSLFLWENHNIIEADWNIATEQMEDEEFQNTIQILWKNLKTYEPKALLANTKNFLYTIPIHIQEWYGANIIENMGEKTKKIAMIVSQGEIEQLSIEQAVDEDQKTGFATRYFVTAEEALQWID